MKTRVVPLCFQRTLQLAGYFPLGIARILQQHDVARSLANSKIVQIAFRTRELKATAIENCFTSTKNIHTVSCGLLGNDLELVGSADRSTYLDQSLASINTIRSVAVYVTLRYR